MVPPPDPPPAEPDRADASAVGWHGHPDDYEEPPAVTVRAVETVPVRGDRL